MTTTETPPERPRTSTTERALSILYFCATHEDGSSFSTLKKVGGGLASMTLSRILNQLVEHGDLRKDAASGLYFCGPRFMQAARAACGRSHLEDLLTSEVEQLARKTGHSAAYFHWDGDWIYIRLKYELPENYHYINIGGRNHPPRHTFFRSIQAHLPRRDLRRIGATDVDELLASIREDGYFVQTEQYRTLILRVTAPVFYGAERKIAGAIGLTSLVTDPDEATLQHMIDSVRASAAQSTRLLHALEHV